MSDVVGFSGSLQAVKIMAKMDATSMSFDVVFILSLDLIDY